MPELAEVETWRRLAETHGVDKQIVRARCVEDRNVFDCNSPRAVAKALAMRRIVATHRKGKVMWMEMDQGPALLLHYGMSGSLHLINNDSPRATHEKLRLIFPDGTALAYYSIRRIGYLRLQQDPLTHPPLSTMGPDPVVEQVPPEFYAARLAKRRSPIKSVLLDQRVFCGIGNWLADEILYAAKLNPHTRACDIERTHLKTLLRCQRTILQRAIDVDADDSRFPSTWLFHVRWGKSAKKNQTGRDFAF